MTVTFFKTVLHFLFPYLFYRSEKKEERCEETVSNQRQNIVRKKIRNIYQMVFLANVKFPKFQLFAQ